MTHEQAVKELQRYYALLEKKVALQEQLLGVNKLLSVIDKHACVEQLKVEEEPEAKDED